MYNINIVESTVLYCYCVHIMTAVSVGYPCWCYQNIVLAIISYIHDTHAATISNVDCGSLSYHHLLSHFLYPVGLMLGLFTIRM